MSSLMRFLCTLSGHLGEGKEEEEKEEEKEEEAKSIL